MEQEELNVFTDLVADEPGDVADFVGSEGDPMTEGASGESGETPAPTPPAAPEGQEPVAPPAPAAVATPSAAPAPQASAVIPPPTPPTAVPVAATPDMSQQPAPAPQPPQGQQPTAPPVDRMAARTEAVKAIASKYQLTEEQREAWAIEPEKVVPQLVGELYADVFEAVFNTVYGMLPALMHAQQQAVRVQSEGEEAFYNEFPALRNADKAVVIQYAQAYKVANPRATRDQFIKAVGTMASAALGLPVGQQAAPAPMPPSPVQRPPIPVRGASAPASGLPQQQQKTIWEEMVTD